MTGQQYELTSGGSRAVITQMGAGLRVFEVDGVPFVETYPADAAKPPMGCGAVLLPWPNRVAGAQWEFHGKPQYLDVTEPALGNAIHGLVRYQPWRAVIHERGRIQLATDVPVQPGWPVPLHVGIRYTIGRKGLTVEHTVRNVGDQPVPFGVGCHPYVRAGFTPRDDCELELAAHTVLPCDPATQIPNAPARDVAGTPVDFRSAVSLAGQRLDTPFGDCRPDPDDPDGLVRHRLTSASGGVEVWADPIFRWVQVFTPDDFPDGQGGSKSALAIEPMTCPPDALNSGVDLITVAPGSEWTARWGITPLT